MPAFRFQLTRADSLRLRAAALALGCSPAELAAQLISRELDREAAENTLDAAANPGLPDISHSGGD